MFQKVKLSKFEFSCKTDNLFKFKSRSKKVKLSKFELSCKTDNLFKFKSRSKKVQSVKNQISRERPINVNVQADLNSLTDTERQIQNKIKESKITKTDR